MPLKRKLKSGKVTKHDTPMNICYLLPFWPYLYTTYLFREIAWLRAQGHHVVVVSLAGPPGPAADLAKWNLTDVPALQVRRQYRSDRELLKTVAALGLRGARIRSKLRLRSAIHTAGVRQGVHEWATLKRIVKFVKAHRVDVIDAHWASEAAAAAVDVKAATDIPFSMRIHGGDAHSHPSPMLPLLVTEASAICPVSEFIADLIRGKRPVAHLPQVPATNIDESKLRICHNGLPDEAIADTPVQQSDDVVRLGTIGRLDPEKRHSDMIAALANVKGEFPHSRLRLVGGGVLQKDLETQAESLGIRDRVEITGAQPWERVIELARGHHIYCQASQVEGCSLATLEGQAQGVPVILSRTGAHGAGVEEGVNGHLFDSGDVDALTTHLRSVLQRTAEEREAMGDVSLRLIRERFRFATLMPRMEAIFDAVRTGGPLPE